MNTSRCHLALALGIAAGVAFAQGIQGPPIKLDRMSLQISDPEVYRKAREQETRVRAKAMELRASEAMRAVRQRQGEMLRELQAKKIGLNEILIGLSVYNKMLETKDSEQIQPHHGKFNGLVLPLLSDMRFQPLGKATPKLNLERINFSPPPRTEDPPEFPRIPAGTGSTTSTSSSQRVFRAPYSGHGWNSSHCRADSNTGFIHSYETRSAYGAGATVAYIRQEIPYHPRFRAAISLKDLTYFIQGNVVLGYARGEAHVVVRLLHNGAPVMLKEISIREIEWGGITSGEETNFFRERSILVDLNDPWAPAIGGAPRGSDSASGAAAPRVELIVEFQSWCNATGGAGVQSRLHGTLDSITITPLR
jgi:hypothetical protein